MTNNINMVPIVLDHNNIKDASELIAGTYYVPWGQVAISWEDINDYQKYFGNMGENRHETIS